MAVKLRLTRVGKKKQPQYRIVVADSRSPRDGRFIEILGHYDPRQNPSALTVDNEKAEVLRVTGLRVEGQAGPILTLTMYPHLLPTWWQTILLGIALLAGAVAFDRATGAAETAASLAVATAACFVGAYAFPGIGSPNPTFRELAGAAIVGALVGGPIGGFVAWSARGRAASGVALSARAR